MIINRTKIFSLALLLAALNAQLSIASAQGSLTPPGAPAPTMKTLAQIEPRTDVLTLPIGGLGAYSITQPGSYYLSSNLVSGAGISGIEIKTNDVTIDLGGFAMIGAGGFRGIFANGSASQRIRIKNGRLTGYTFGIDCASLAAVTNVIIEDVQLVGFGGAGGVGVKAASGLTVRRSLINGFNGSSGAALQAGNYSHLEQCTAQNNAAGMTVGTDSKLFGCLSVSNNSDGIVAGAGSVVNDCICRFNHFNGFTLGDAVAVSHCTAALNGQEGIVVGNFATMNNSITMSNADTGITVGNGCNIFSCAGNGNQNFGYIGVGGNTIKDCSFTGNVRGIVAYASTVSGCSVRANSSIGIFVTDNSLVLNNQCDANGSSGIDAGIYVNGLGNRIEGNTMTGNFVGLNVAVANNLIIRNSARGNTTNYVAVANNKIGTIVAAPNSGAISGSTGGAGVGSTDPWANFSF